MKKKAGPASTGKRKTKPTPVWLDEEQIVWLKAQPNGVSGTVRNLVFEAMNLANLARSVKKSKKPKIKTSKKA